MRIVSITHYTAMMGANRSWLHLLSGLRARGVEVMALCPAEGPVTEALRHAGIQVLVRPYANGAYTLRTPAFWLYPWRLFQTKFLFMKELESRIQAFQPDIIHSNSMAVSLGWQLSERLQRPHVWHIREHGVLDYRLVFPLGKQHFFKKLQAASAIICISKAILEALPEGITAPRHLIYNGIGNRRTLAARRTESGEKEHFTFLMLGLLHPSKQQHQAIEAFSKICREYPRARLVIAGGGRRLYTWKLSQMIRRLGISDQASMTGYVSNPENLYQQSDVCLMCSRFEAMGRVTAEAFSYGKPVIGFNGGGTAELITPDVNGFIYQNTDELATLMRRFLDTPSLAASMREAAFQTALEGFSDEMYVEKCLQVFEKVAANFSS